MRAVDEAIKAVWKLAQVHGLHQEYYDSIWMDTLDKMIVSLRHRTDDCYRARRNMHGLAVPAMSH